jgi:hypothetical protein
LLHVYESGAGDGTLKVGNAQGGDTTNVGKQGSSAYGATSAGDAFLYTSTVNLSLMADGASSTIKFSTGGNTERMRIDSSGNVGIGTSSPTNGKLEVTHSSSTVPAGFFRNTSGSGDSPALTVQGGANNAAPNFSVLDYNGNTDFVVQGLGNVGIGTSSPAYKLDVASAVIQFGDSTDAFAQYKSSAGNWHVGANSSNAFAFYSGTYGSGAERMRIDSSGNLFVGKSGFGNNTAGHQIEASGLLRSVRANGDVALFNRTSSDGDIVNFRKDDSTVGSIGSHAGIYTYIGTQDTALVFAHNIDAILPFSTSASNYRDNAIDLGSTSFRFQDIYATNGTIQTSDRNEKQDIEALSDAETRVAQACKGLLRKFRWKDAVAEKGDDARIHFGIIAQDLQDAFAAEGLDAGRYAMFISSTWTDEETGEERTRLGVRYPELLAFIIAAI